MLTITLIRCINLKGDDITSYVRFLVSDEHQDLVQKSAPVFSQQSPRWGTKFDFVMITAGGCWGRPGLGSQGRGVRGRQGSLERQASTALQHMPPG